LIKYGQRIRQASRFARYSLAIERDLGLEDTQRDRAADMVIIPVETVEK